MPYRPTGRPTGRPRKEVQPVFSKDRPDPLLETALTEEQKAYLTALAEVGMKDLACRVARERTGRLVWAQTLQVWRKDQVFANLETQVHGEYWDQYAARNVQAVIDGKKLSGGEANILMQQLNRSKPEEYLQAIQQQIHQTVTYRAEGEFTEEPAKDQSIEKVEKKVAAAEVAPGAAPGVAVLVPLAPGKH